MARQLRDDEEGGWHHVMNRGADGSDTFSCEADRTHFIHLLGEATERCGTELHSYALMSNHYHLILHCPDGGVSDTLQHVSAVYTRRFNHRHGHDGSLFRGRFFSVSITGTEQLITAVRYVHRNPLDIVGLDQLADYPWSSYPAYIGRAAGPSWLSKEPIRSLIGSPSRHRAFVEDARPEEERSVTEEIAHLVGSTNRRRTGAPTMSEIEAAVIGAAGCGHETLAESRRGSKNLPRLIAILVAVDDAALPSVFVGDHFGLSAAGVRSSLHRARRATSGDLEAARLLYAVRRRLSELPDREQGVA